MDTPEKKITRRDLPAVVKRAAELAAVDDPDDQISEDEVIRIAAELGLSERHVKAALYEGATEQGPPTFLDRQFGDRCIIASRSVPVDVEKVKRALETYFTTSEYMTVVRRQPESIMLEPAADTMSYVFRAFKRGSQHQLAAAKTLEVSMRSLEPGWTHVRLRAVFKDERRGHFAGAIIGGTLLGSLIGATAGSLGWIATNDLIVVMTAGTTIGIGSGAAIFAGILSSMRRNYREWRERTNTHAEGVLDRVEKGQSASVGAVPWFKKLQQKLEDL